MPLSLFRNNSGNKASAAGFTQFHNHSHLNQRQHHAHLKLNANELSSIQKIQKFFFMNIDEHLKKLDGFYLCNKQDKHGFKETPFNYDAMNKELRNALISKLNEIKVRFQIVILLEFIPLIIFKTIFSLNALNDVIWELTFAN